MGNAVMWTAAAGGLLAGIAFVAGYVIGYRHGRIDTQERL